MAEYAAGLICLSGCLSSETSVALLNGQDDKAAAIAGEYRDIFGRRQLLHRGRWTTASTDQRKILRRQIDLARSLDVPIVATNDLHYTLKEDAKPHDVLLCIQQQKVQTDTKRLRFDSEEFYLKSAEEMREVFRELPEACDNTLAIAERCSSWTWCTAIARRPISAITCRDSTRPVDSTATRTCASSSTTGAAERYEQITPEIRDRIDTELGVITSMGFGGYFLIVWDLIRYATRARHPRRARAVAVPRARWCPTALRITDLDPLRYGLLFERFLNPDRIQMPDIDMDFDERRRDEVIRYATEKYGSDHVAQIVTFQTIKGKQGIRDAARVLGFPPVVGDRLCKMYPPAIMGRDYPSKMR